MTIKIYTKEKAIALKLAKEKIDKMDNKSRLNLALKLNLSIRTIESYLYGSGDNFETSLRIIEG